GIGDAARDDRAEDQGREPRVHQGADAARRTIPDRDPGRRKAPAVRSGWGDRGDGIQRRNAQSEAARRHDRARAGGPVGTWGNCIQVVATHHHVKPLLSLLGLLLSGVPARAQTATDTERVYSEDQLTLAPVVLRQPTVYPDSLKRKGIGGTVGVSVVLDRKGHPDSGSVRVMSTPDSVLNEPARAVVLGSHYAPGRVEDRAVRARVVVEVAFDPRDTATAP